MQWQFCISYALPLEHLLTDLSLKLRVKTNFRIVNAFSAACSFWPYQNYGGRVMLFHLYTDKCISTYTFCLLSFWMGFTWTKLLHSEYSSLSHIHLSLSLFVAHLLCCKQIFRWQEKRNVRTTIYVNCLLVVDFSGFQSVALMLNKRRTILIYAVAHSDFDIKPYKSCVGKMRMSWIGWW